MVIKVISGEELTASDEGFGRSSATLPSTHSGEQGRRKGHGACPHAFYAKARSTSSESRT